MTYIVSGGALNSTHSLTHGWAGMQVGWMIQPTHTPACDGQPRVRGCWIEKRTEVQRRWR